MNGPAAGSQSIEAFRSVLHQHCGRFDALAHDGRVRGNFRRLSLGDIAAVHVSYDVRRIVRDASDIRKDPGRYFYLIIQRAGRSAMNQAGRESVLRPGDAVLIDAELPSIFVPLDGMCEQMSLHLPHSEARARFRSDLTGGLHFAREEPLSAALQSVLQRLVLDGSEASQLVQEGFMTLFGAQLADRRTGRLTSSLVQRALAVIARGHRQAGFGAGDVSEALGVTPRRLQRAFAPLGRTVAREIADARLATARGLLLSGSSVTEAAFDAGYTDLAHFHRAYAKRYGESPGRSRDALGKSA